MNALILRPPAASSQALPLKAGASPVSLVPSVAAPLALATAFDPIVLAYLDFSVASNSQYVALLAL